VENLSTMLGRLKSYISENDLFRPGDRIIVTVSGGIDSVVLLDLLLKLDYTCAIAHCNFKLRNDESDGDEKFVRYLAEKYEIPVFIRNFETSEYADNNKLSIQMAARELRYDWFEELRQESEYDFITTAHNKNDVIETFLLNLSRGTGIQGLTGIKNRNGRLIRPLLFASRQEIKEYALENNVDWREDSSNASAKYSRNKIRLNIIPLFEEINPRFADTLEENIRKLKEAEDIYIAAILEKRKEFVVREPAYAWIQVTELVKLQPIDTWTFELLSDFNFTAGVVKDIIRSLDGPSGRQFFSSTHRLVKDRGKLLIHPLREENLRRYYIDDPHSEFTDPIPLEMEVIPYSPEYRISSSPSVACLDFDRLEFPLVLRKWEPGDYFRPLGMNKMKKLSDFFIDIKLSLPEKENTWILQSGKEIAWIVGLRIDDHFKIRPDTGKIFKISRL
jgi:tRNA(Ile)-lysidine synthase